MPVAEDPLSRSRYELLPSLLACVFPDDRLMPYRDALWHEREYLRLVGRMNLEDRATYPNGLPPELLKKFRFHLAEAAQLSTLWDIVTAARVEFGRDSEVTRPSPAI